MDIYDIEDHFLMMHEKKKSAKKTTSMTTLHDHRATRIKLESIRLHKEEKLRSQRSKKKKRNSIRIERPAWLRRRKSAKKSRVLIGQKEKKRRFSHDNNHKDTMQNLIMGEEAFPLVGL